MFQLAWVLVIAGLLTSLVLIGLFLAGSRPNRLATATKPGLVEAAQLDIAVGSTPGSGPTAAVFADGSLWLTTASSVDRIEPTSGAVLATIEVGEHPGRLAFDGATLWVTVTGAGAVAGIDPRYNVVTQRFAVGGAPVGLTIADGSLWVATSPGDVVLRLDPASGDTLATIPLARSPVDLAASPGAIWATTNRGAGFSVEAALLRIDPASNRLVGTVPGGGGALVAQGDAVWFLTSGTARIDRLDPASGRVIAGVALHNGATAMASGDGYVWVYSDQGFVERIETSTNTLFDETRVTLPASGQWDLSGTFGAGSGWLWSYDARQVIRIDPVR